MEYFIIYLLVQVESFACLFAGFAKISIVTTAIVGGMTLFVCGLESCSSQHSYTHILTNGVPKYILKWCKRLLVTGLVCSVLATMLPTQKNLAIIVGSGMVYNAVTSDTGKRIANKAAEALEQKIDAILTQSETSVEPVQGERT
ncbi:hypothetical protein D3C84_103870 [compost metagenome]